MFVGMCLFFLKSSAHGNETIGVRFATFTFYAMKENETLFSAFIANGTFRNVAITGVKQYSILMFNSWTRGSVGYKEAILQNHSRIWFKIAGTSIFDYLFILAIIMTIIIIAVKGSGRIRYNDIIDGKSGKAQGKRMKAPKDILSMKFGVGYKKHRTGDNSDSSEDEE